VLRAARGNNGFLIGRCKALCAGNNYSATIHAINAGLIRLSKCGLSEPLYRGIAGLRVLTSFLVPDMYGVRGGVEFGFMSATTDRSVALHYASSSQSGIVYEIQQTMTSKGADLSWLSQYPHEKETCFPPRTGPPVEPVASPDAGAFSKHTATSCAAPSRNSPHPSPPPSGQFSVSRSRGRRVVGPRHGWRAPSS
jgi:hypothetical protein